MKSIIVYLSGKYEIHLKKNGWNGDSVAEKNKQFENRT